MKKIYLLGLACLLAVALAVPCGAESNYYQRQISSYDEYQDHIASATLPNDFVYYDDICELGEFDCFIYTHGDSEYAYYTYVLVDGTGNKVTLVIRMNGEAYDRLLDESYILTEEHIHNTDMSMVDYFGVQSGYVYDGITYMYSYAELSSISWRHDGVWYKLSGDFSGYGDSMDTTATGKLLNLSTAREMVDLISAPYGEKIPTDITTAAPLDETTRLDEQGPTWFDRHSNAIWVIGISSLMIGAAVTFGILSHKVWRI